VERGEDAFHLLVLHTLGFGGPVEVLDGELHRAAVVEVVAVLGALELVLLAAALKPDAGLLVAVQLDSALL
jgi:hypothetical protein